MDMSIVTLLLLTMGSVVTGQLPRNQRHPGDVAFVGIRESILQEQQEIQQFQRHLNQTVTQLRQLVQELDQLVVANPGQVPEACSQLPTHFQQMYNDVTFLKARTETIGLELRSRVDNLWVHSGQEFARIQQQLEVLLEDQDSLPRAVHFLVSLHQNIYSNSSPQTMLFDRKLRNLGEGYDQHSGHFRCPVAGIYVFNMGMSLAHGSGVEAKLLHDGATLLRLQLQQADQSHSAGVSTQCQEGQNFWVEISHESTTPVQINSDSYLSGALVSTLQ